MDVHAFLRTRPCLEGIEGYLDGLRMQIAHPEILHCRAPQYEAIDGDVLKPIEAYRLRLMSGKEVPAPTALEQAWVYKSKARPERKRQMSHSGSEPELDLTEEYEEPVRPKVLDLNARKKK